MGIRYLNNFLKNNCKKSINTIHLKDLSYKCLVVDVSIYMYHFEMEGKLIENMKKMIDLFKLYNINAVFVFDGKPPIEKNDIILYRKQQREDAALICSQISNQLQTENLNESDKEKLLIEYNKLKRTSVCITREKVKSIKELFNDNNVHYINAVQEADQVCALLVSQKNFWGCISDDMDMFVYGCRFIIRDLNIFNETAVLYNLNDILCELNITYENFKRICIISGTDYNSNINNNIVIKSENNIPQTITLYTALKLYNRFQKNVKYRNMTFYDWLKYYIKYNVDYEKLNKIYNMFTNDNCIQNVIKT